MCLYDCNCVKEEESKGLGFVTAEEEEEAKKLIEKELGFKPGVPTGYHILVKLYIRPEQMRPLLDDEGKQILNENGEPVSIVLPETSRQMDKFANCVALVMAKGPDAYKGKRFEHSGPWCRVGDWVIIPRNEGIQFNQNGVTMQVLPDDRVVMVINEPSQISRD